MSHAGGKHKHGNGKHRQHEQQQQQPGAEPEQGQSLVTRATGAALAQADTLADAAVRTAAGWDASLGVTAKATALGMPGLAASAAHNATELAAALSQWGVVSTGLRTAAATDAWLLGGRGAAAVDFARGPGVAYVQRLAARYVEARDASSKKAD